jgi:hypothetical protein
MSSSLLPLLRQAAACLDGAACAPRGRLAIGVAVVAAPAVAH